MSSSVRRPIALPSINTRRPNICRFSRPVSRQKTPRSPANITPMRVRTSVPSRTVSWPQMLALPEVGSSSVESMRAMVVLPAPLGPSSP